MPEAAMSLCTNFLFGAVIFFRGVYGTELDF